LRVISFLMKNLLLIGFLFSFLSSVSAQEDLTLTNVGSVESVAPDSIVKFIWTGTEDWEAYVRVLVEKDSAGRKSIETTLFGHNTWTNNKRTLYEYDEVGYISKWWMQYWYDTIWGNGSQHIYIYDTDGNVLVHFTQHWYNNEWIDREKLEYTYDHANRKLSETTSGWFDGWVLKEQSIFIYNPSGQLLEVLDSYYQQSDSTWLMNQRLLCTYDDEGLKVTELYQRYDEDSWKNYLQFLSAYDSEHNRIRIVRQIPDGPIGWIDELSENYTFDLFGNVIEEVTQSYDNGDWNNEYRYMYAYNDKQNLLTKEYQFWSGRWINRDSSHYYYPEVTETTSLEEIIEIIIFPNPVGNSLQVYSPHELGTPASITIYSVQGNLVGDHKWGGQGIQELYLGDLSPGIYFVHLHAPGKSILKKVIRL
jgi:hypothetical protein